MRLVLLMILISLCHDLFAQVNDPSAALLNQKLIDFEAKTIHGEVINTKNWQGEIIVLNFWFTRCAPCLNEISQLNKVATAFSDKSVHFVAVTWEKDIEVLRKFALLRNMKYTSVGDGKLIIDKYLLRLYPTNIVIDQNGVVRFVESGYYGDIEKKLSKIIIDCIKDSE